MVTVLVTPLYRVRCQTQRSAVRSIHYSVACFTRLTNDQQADSNLRDRSVAYIYRFHTNILRVNKQISTDAKGTPYRDNVFVVISYRWPSFGATMHAYDVSIVTEHLQAAAGFEAGGFVRTREHYWRLIRPCLEGLIFSTPDAICTSDAAEMAVVVGRLLIDATASYGFLKLRDMDLAGAEKAEQQCQGLSTFISQFEDRGCILGFEGQPRATWLLVSGAFHLTLLLTAKQTQTQTTLHSVVSHLEHVKRLRRESEHIAHGLEIVSCLREKCKIGSTLMCGSYLNLTNSLEAGGLWLRCLGDEVGGPL